MSDDTGELVERMFRTQGDPAQFFACFDVGDSRAVCVLRIVGSGRSTGLPIDQGLSTLMTAKQGKITEILSFETKEEALAAVNRG
jgi:hypothetical protein